MTAPAFAPPELPDPEEVVFTPDGEIAGSFVDPSDPYPAPSPSVFEDARFVWEEFARRHKARHTPARGVELEDFLLRADARWRYPALLRAVIGGDFHADEIVKFNPSEPWQEEVRRIAASAGQRIRN